MNNYRPIIIGFSLKVCLFGPAGHIYPAGSWRRNFTRKKPVGSLRSYDDIGTIYSFCNSPFLLFIYNYKIKKDHYCEDYPVDSKWDEVVFFDVG